MSFKVIITGSTGMVGEGVLHECLNSAEVSQVLLINRKPYGLTHPKVKEVIHPDFFDLSRIESQLNGYDACFFCLGVSSVGMKEAKYYELTYTLTMELATRLSRINPAMAFTYVSGAGTYSTEKSRGFWPRIKGKTENDLMKLPFSKVFPFRPGFIKPTKGLKNTHKFYAFINWMFPLGRAIFPAGFCTMRELGQAMIRSVALPDTRKVFEGKDIIALGKV